MGAKPGRMKGNEQKAKYRKPEKKHGKPGGREGGKRGSRKEEPKHWVRPLKRRRQEAGNGRTEGQVAGTVREADERKRKETGKRPKAKAQGKHSWNSCGSEARKGERKQTGSRVREPGKKARETRPGRSGKPGKRKRRRALRKPL